MATRPIPIRHFGRPIAGLLALSLASGPSSAYGLKPTEARESAGLESLEDALAPVQEPAADGSTELTAGLEAHARGAGGSTHAALLELREWLVGEIAGQLKDRQWFFKKEVTGRHGNIVLRIGREEEGKPWPDRLTVRLKIISIRSVLEVTIDRHIKRFLSNQETKTIEFENLVNAALQRGSERWKGAWKPVLSGAGPAGQSTNYPKSYRFRFKNPVSARILLGGNRQTAVKRASAAVASAELQLLLARNHQDRREISSAERTLLGAQQRLRRLQGARGSSKMTSRDASPAAGPSTDSGPALSGVERAGLEGNLEGFALPQLLGSEFESARDMETKLGLGWNKVPELFRLWDGARFNHQKGYEALAEGRYDAAEISFRYAQSQWQEARHYLERVTENNPDPEALEALLEAGKRAQAAFKFSTQRALHTAAGLEGEPLVWEGSLRKLDEVLNVFQEHNPWQVDILDGSDDPPISRGCTTDIPRIDEQGNPYLLYHLALVGAVTHLLHKSESVYYDVKITRDHPGVPSDRTYAQVVLVPTYDTPAAGLEAAQEDFDPNLLGLLDADSRKSLELIAQVVFEPPTEAWDRQFAALMEQLEGYAAAHYSPGSIAWDSLQFLRRRYDGAERTLALQIDLYRWANAYIWLPQRVALVAFLDERSRERLLLADSLGYELYQVPGVEVPSAVVYLDPDSGLLSGFGSRRGPDLGRAEGWSTLGMAFVGLSSLRESMDDTRKEELTHAEDYIKRLLQGGDKPERLADLYEQYGFRSKAPLRPYVSRTIAQGSIDEADGLLTEMRATLRGLSGPLAVMRYQQDQMHVYISGIRQRGLDVVQAAAKTAFHTRLGGEKSLPVLADIGVAWQLVQKGVGPAEPSADQIQSAAREIWAENFQDPIELQTRRIHPAEAEFKEPLSAGLEGVEEARKRVERVLNQSISQTEDFGARMAVIGPSLYRDKMPFLPVLVKKELEFFWDQILFDPGSQEEWNKWLQAFWERRLRKGGALPAFYYLGQEDEFKLFQEFMSEENFKMIPMKDVITDNPALFVIQLLESIGLKFSPEERIQMVRDIKLLIQA